MGYYRAGVLIGVHVLMIAHVIWWLASGQTISPVEPSESMQTLEQGVINAGFVFFAGAILITLIAGRFVCGWSCHIIAMQDLCRWLMLKMGIRPKPFRSRLLMLVPLGLALYMFVWPNFKRFALFPALDALGVDRPIWLKPVAAFHGFETEFLVEDYWATFPPWFMVAPFIFVVGFAIVYFLGAKGFCTYGCPYGGFFSLADRFSPLRVRVTDACEGCGQCTAHCTSNVRVHEEVRDFGMVVNPGCMKCLDCVSVCPTEALYVGLGRPAVLARRRVFDAKRMRPSDLDLVEEIVVAAAFLVLFLCYRQMMGQVPMLMAVGMAGIGAFCTWLLIRMVRDQNARVQNVQLKYKGKIRPAGVVFAVLCGLAFVAAGWSGTVRYNRWQADMLHAGVVVPSSLALQPEFAATPGDRKRAMAALERYARADSFSRGGFGWALNADELVRVAYLRVVLGQLEQAEAALREVIEKGKPTDSLVFELGAVMRARGVDEGAISQMMSDALARHDMLHAVRRELAVRAAASAGIGQAEKIWDAAPARAKERAWYWIERARYWGALGSIERATDALEAARDVLDNERSGGALAAVEMAELAGALGESSLMSMMIEEAQAREPRDPETRLRLAALLFQIGRNADGLAWLERAESSRHASVGALVTASQIRQRLGDQERSLELLDRARERAGGRAWEMLQVGGAYIAQGRGRNEEALVETGLAIIDEAIALKPDSAQLHGQKAIALANLERLEEASEAMALAAELGADNVVLAQRAAELFEHAGNAERAAHWRAEAERRRTAATGSAPG